MVDGSPMDPGRAYAAASKTSERFRKIITHENRAVRYQRSAFWLTDLAERSSPSARRFNLLGLRLRAHGKLAGMMLARDVLEVVDRLSATGVRAWLDGGWGVDALIGRQTRDHDDLDLVIPLPEAGTARRALTALGFEFTEDEATLCFVARDADDRRVDVHTVVFDEEGGGLQRQEDGTSWRYPPEGFSGIGRVENRAVACLTAEVQVLCHLNYEPDTTDRRDMRLLAESCGVTLSAPYGS